MIAGAITTADASTEIETDPSIGELKYYLKSWGNPEDQGTVRYTELRTRQCTMADFNDDQNSNPESGFYQLADGYIKDVQTYMRKMLCIIDEDKPLLRIHGNWNTANLANLMVVFELCD